MNAPSAAIARAAAWATLLAGAGAAVLAQPATFPEPGDARLQQGRTVWLATCRDCHANPMSDAPQVRRPADWQARLARGRPALYASALGGRVAASGAEMPARGDHAHLGDDEVRAAVDYMLFLVDSRKESK